MTSKTPKRMILERSIHVKQENIFASSKFVPGQYIHLYKFKPLNILLKFLYSLWRKVFQVKLTLFSGGYFMMVMDFV